MCLWCTCGACGASGVPVVHMVPVGFSLANLQFLILVYRRKLSGSQNIPQNRLQACLDISHNESEMLFK
jgi:hypothetical protein